MSISSLDLAATYLDLVPRAMGEIRREIRSHRGERLTVPQFRVLALVRREEKTNKELAENIGLSVAAMSRLVQTLVDEGWLEKSAGKNDRRELRIRLSTQGRKSFEKIRTQARQGLASRLEALSVSDRKVLEKGFRALTASLPDGDSDSITL